MKKFIETILNIYNIEELRGRIITTLTLLLVYRLGAQVVLPGIDSVQLAELSNRTDGGGLLGILNAGNGYYLWGVGDGGGSNDPDNNGQNESSPLSSIHYFKYDGTSISPVMFNSDGSSTYILHKGLRNPWKFDVDNENRLWIADVGQYCYEEVNVGNLFDQSNFGWSTREGMHNYDPSDDCTSPPSPLDDNNLTDPVTEYPHYGGNCSIIGGFWVDKGPESFAA